VIHGVDVSPFQTNIDWALVRVACDFAIIKVTEGNGYTNPKAVDQVTGSVGAGLETVLYHFANPNGPDWLNDAAQEAKRLDDIADLFEQKLGRKFFCFLDVERNTPLTTGEIQPWRDWAREFRRVCRENGQRAIGWYSGRYFTQALGLDSSWQNTLLWLAQYPNLFRADGNYGFWPKTIAPWMRADLWQHGGGMLKGAGGNESACPGIEGFADMNSFAGSRDELEELIAAAT